MENPMNWQNSKHESCYTFPNRCHEHTFILWSHTYHILLSVGSDQPRPATVVSSVPSSPIERSVYFSASSHIRGLNCQSNLWKKIWWHTSVMLGTDRNMRIREAVKVERKRLEFSDRGLDWGLPHNNDWGPARWEEERRSCVILCDSPVEQSRDNVPTFQIRPETRGRHRSSQAEPEMTVWLSDHHLVRLLSHSGSSLLATPVSTV